MDRKKNFIKRPSSFLLLKKFYLVLLLIFFSRTYLSAQTELIINTTGYGFNKSEANGINAEQWDYIKKFVNISYNGQDASVTAVRLHIEWHQYEPTFGNYQRKQIVEAVKAILALKPGMKFALHFPYQRPGYWNDSYFSTDDIAQTRFGAFVRNEIAYACPSMYSDYATTRFYAFVDDVLTQISAYYPQLLYVQMGNSPAEEFAMPFNNGNPEPGLYEQAAVKAWREKFLPLRFPNKTTAKWGNQEYEIKNSPQPMDGNWTSDMGKDLHRFAGWGLLKKFEGFYRLVKRHSSSIKVLYFISDFGSQQGNLRHLHNSTIPLALQLADGIYSSDGTNPWDVWRKISVPDIVKGTDPNKIAAVEFDPEDLGEPRGGNGLEGNLPMEWLPRAYKHGTNYVHIAMHFTDLEIYQLKPALAKCRAEFVNNTYRAPARAAAIPVNIYPNVFTENYLFEEWKNGGMDWGSTDNTPKSIKMSDDGYWDNLWDSYNLLPCTFTINAAASNNKPKPGSKTTLSVACSGGECDGTKFTWNGQGVTNVIGSSVEITAPSTPGNYAYTVKTSRSGCMPKTSTTTLLSENPLPVTLVKFTAIKENKTAQLTWQTTSETNSDRFEIEHSLDGKEWNKIGSVKSNGDTYQSISNYSFADNTPVSGENLYRLKMIDRDETFAFSAIRSVQLEHITFVSIYPNPASNKLVIATENWKEIKNVQILSNTGNIVFDSGTEPEPEIDITSLTQGSYLIRLISKNGVSETLKFVKKG